MSIKNLLLGAIIGVIVFVYFLLVFRSIGPRYEVYPLEVEEATESNTPEE